MLARKTAARRPSVARPVSLPEIPYSGPVTFKAVSLDLNGVLASIARNTGNRPIRAAKVKEYARLMLLGEWEWELFTIVIQADDGSQHNGQHSRKAFVLAHSLARSPEYINLPSTKTFLQQRLNCLELIGVPRSACDWIDQGIVRNAADQAAARDLISIEQVADLVGSKGTAEQQESRFQTLKKTIAAAMQFSEAVVWKRQLGKLPRTNVGKLASADMQRSLSCMSGHSLPAAEFVVRSAIGAKYSVLVPKKDKDGKEAQGKKSIQPLSKRINPAYLGAAHMLACSAYGTDGLECLTLLTDILSSPLPDNGTATIELSGPLADTVNDSPALRAFVALFNSIPLNEKGNHKGGNELQDAKFIWLMRCLKCICEDITEVQQLPNSVAFAGPEHIGDPFRSSAGESNEAVWRLGVEDHGLDILITDPVSKPTDCEELQTYLLAHPQPDIFEGDDLTPETTETLDDISSETDTEADDIDNMLAGFTGE